MRRLLLILGLLLCAVGAPAQTTTFNGVIKDLTSTPVPTGQVTFQLKPGIDTTISGSSRFVPATTFCEIHNPGVVSTSGTGTITVVVDTAQNWLVGDSLIFVGTPDATLNASSVASPYVITTRNSSTSFVFTQSGAHANGAGGTVGGLYKSGGTGACAVMQNTAIMPANTSYTVAIQAIFSPSSAFNAYAIGSGPVDISTVVPTPSQMPAYSFVDAFSNQAIAGNKSFTAPVSFAALATFAGPVILSKLQGVNYYADQNCSGITPLDIGICINNTIALMPTVSGYPVGTVRLDGFALASAWVWNTLVTVNSPYVSIIGPGQSQLRITGAVLTGDHLRIKTSPFAGATFAGQFGGFTLVGGSQSNAVGIHIGDITGVKLQDLRVSNFTGTGASGIWQDNVTDYTEELTIDRVWLDNNTKAMRLTNTNGSANSASFGHQNWINLKINVNASQIGISFESGTLYAGYQRINGGGSGVGGVMYSVSGLQYTAGPAAAVTGILMAGSFETAGTGTMFSVGAGNTLSVAGNITMGGSLSNSCTGTCEFNPGAALGNANFSNYLLGANSLFLGGAPGAANLPQFNANSGSTIAGVTASNYYVLRSGVAGVEAHSATGDVGLAGGINTLGISSFPGNAVALTADWTCGTAGTVPSCVAPTIIGSGGGVPLTFTLPPVARSYTLECDGVVGQATAATANQWNLLTATNGATNVTANYSMATAATASAFGAVTDQASTTTTFQIAPSWTLGGTGTKMPFHIWAKIEGASASGTVVSLQLVAPTVGDLVTIYRGAACTVF